MMAPQDTALVETPLHRIAHARTGDKGDRINISLICYDARTWQHVLAQVTEERVRECFRHRHPGAVRRYTLPALAACNFVIDDVLGGGVNNSLGLDRHGKGLSSLLLSMSIQLPSALLPKR